VKRIIKLLSFISFIIFSLVLTTHSGQITGATEGDVLDTHTKNPIHKAKITLINANIGSIKYELYTNKKGHFYQSGMTPSIYKITIEKEGYFPRSDSIRVRLGNPEKLEITLEPFQGQVSQFSEKIEKGTKLLDEENYEEAIQIFTEGLTDDSSNPLIFYYRGMAFEKNGDIDNAMGDYQKAAELKTDFILPLSQLGKIHARQGNYEKAVEYYRKIADSGDKDATNYYNYGICLMNIGNNAEAKSVFEKLLSFDEDYSDAYYRLGIIYLSSNETEKAKELLQKFIEMDPENANASTANEILKALK